MTFELFLEQLRMQQPDNEQWQEYIEYIEFMQSILEDFDTSMSERNYRAWRSMQARLEGGNNA